MFNKFKKPYFWPTYPIFGAKKIFQKFSFVAHNFIWVSDTMAKFRKK